MKVLFALISVYFINFAECANILGVSSLISPSHHLWNEVIMVELAKNGHNVTFLSHDKGRLKHENCSIIELEGVSSLISPSHHLWNEVIMVELAKNGHNVTFLSHDKGRLKHENCSIIELEGVYEKIDGAFDIEEYPNSIALLAMDKFWHVVDVTCALDIETDGFKFLWNYPKDFKFDLIIWDVNAGQCLYPLIKRFGNPPLVATSPFGHQPFIADMMGHHIPSYIPFMIFPYTDRMNFWQRTLNAVYNNYVNFVRTHWLLKKTRKVAQEKLGIEVDEYQKIERNFSVALVNTDPVYNFPETFPPNIIPVAGIHIIPAKPLPKDLKEVFANSPKGVIMFTLGTNVKAERVNKEVMTSFVKCFETLPYTVLWKINSTEFVYPKNVITRPWLPQNDILANPNTKLFISHCGALSTQEAMYHGVPIVGFPFFYDQWNIAEKIVVRKLGEKIEYSEASPEYICSKINQVLEDPTYTRNMKLISQRVKDQPNTPLERGVFWVEYVLRQGGAEHLSLSIKDVTAFESLNLDIMCFLLAVIVVVVFVIYIVIRKITLKQAKIKTR